MNELLERELPEYIPGFNDLPVLQTDADGRRWLFFRHRTIRARDTPDFTPAHRAAWQLYGTAYVGGEWTRPLHLPFSRGRQDVRWELASDGRGALFAVLVDRWLRDGTVRPATRIEEAPRIVLVSSEAHRSAGPIDFDRFGAFADYGVRYGIKHYGASKLVMSTYATELSRRLNCDGEGHVVVHSLCPGPVRTAIAREAPLLLKPLVYPLMRLFFLPPARAAAPVSYLCCAGDAGKRSGIYLHMMREKRPSELATSRSNGARLWEASETLVRMHAPPGC